MARRASRAASGIVMILGVACIIGLGTPPAIAEENGLPNLSTAYGFQGQDEGEQNTGSGTASTEAVPAPIGDSSPEFHHYLAVEVAPGVKDEAGAGSTAFGEFAASYAGFIPRTNIGFQAAASLGRLEGGDLQEDFTVGVFQKNVNVEDVKADGGVLFDYRRTGRDSDLFAFRFVGGVTVNDSNDRIGVRTRFALNDETVRRTPLGRVREKLVNRTDIDWDRFVVKQIAAGASVGYQFGEVNSVVVGLRASTSVHPGIRLVPQGEFNFDGDYALGVAFVFELGHLFDRNRSAGESAPNWAQPLAPYPRLTSLELAQETR